MATLARLLRTRLVANNSHMLRISFSHPPAIKSPPLLSQERREIRWGLPGANITTQASRVSSNAKDQFRAAREEVKEALGTKNQSSSGSSDAKSKHEAGSNGQKATNGEEKAHQSGSSFTAETLFDRLKASVSSASPKVSMAFKRLKEVKVTDIAKKGYDIIKDEISGKPSKKKHLEYTPSPSVGQRSTRTDVTIVHTERSKWSKKMDDLKEKIRSHPIYKRVRGASDPVVVKSQEIAEDVMEKWETSDSPIVHKIQDLNESIFQETDAATTLKEIRQRDPSFSLPEFLAEVQEVVRPVLTAYIKGDYKTLEKYCSPEVIQRRKAEEEAFRNHGIFYDNKILHISDVDVRETKMMGTSPIIIIAFRTQQIHCVRDRNGAVTEGGEDTIHTVYYAWAMQLVEPEELGEDAMYPIWRLRDLQQLGVQALI